MINRYLPIILLLTSLALSSNTYSNPRNVFLEPDERLPESLDLDFRVGQALFEKIWVFAPASTTASDGLGPLYNARSCSRCHVRNGRGMIEGSPSSSPALFMRISIEPVNESAEHIDLKKRHGLIPEPVYGKQIQTFAYPGGKAEAKLDTHYSIHYETLNEGVKIAMHTPHYQLNNLAYGALHIEHKLSPRLTPPMIGLGLLEAIDDNDILSWADPDDKDGNGISGKANQVWDAQSQSIKLGRFGWKAGQPNLDQQNSAALLGDIGISTSLFTQHFGDCTPKQKACRNQIHGNRLRNDLDSKEPEASDKVSDTLLLYTRFIKVPKQRSHPLKEKGRAIFDQVGCANCHRPYFQTSEHAEEKALRQQNIWPYTDLLLHDMGPDLADNRKEFQANGREWRTPPLWGIGLTRLVGGAEFYLHDGRARSLLEAILWHGGEAQSSTDKVKALSTDDRQALIHFLESI